MAWYDPRTWFADSHALPSVYEAISAPVEPVEPDEPIVANGHRIELRTRGWAGTRAYAGKITGHELNPALQDDKWLIAERQMRRTDASVGAAWRATRDSLLSARWRTTPGDPEDPVSRQIADDANRMFGFDGYGGRLHRPWEDGLEQAVLFYTVGFRYGEVRFANTAHGIDIVDPWVDREPLAHDKWIFDDDGKWVGVVQKPPIGDLGRALTCGPFIPATELIYLGHGVEGQALEGCGALRPAWDSWERKRGVSDMAMQGFERWSVGVPEIVILEREARDAGVKRTELEVQVDFVRRGISAFLTGDAAWIETTPFVKVQTYGGDLDPSKAIGQLAALDGDIKSVLLLQWLNLGTSTTGARSVGEVHHSLFRTSLCQVLDRVAAAYSGEPRPGGGAIGRWARLNYPGVRAEQLPRFEHLGLSADPLTDALDRLKELTESGWLDPSEQGDKDAVRQRLGFGQMETRAEVILDEEIGVEPTDEDGEPDLPEVRPGDYSSRNRDVADLLGCSTARVNSLVRRSVAAGLEVPAIGSGRDRLWELKRVHGWYAALTGERKAPAEPAAVAPEAAADPAAEVAG